MSDSLIEERKKAKALRESPFGTWVWQSFDVRHWAEQEIRFYCKLHRDREGNAFIDVAPRTWYCRKCGREGTLEDLALELGIPQPPAVEGGGV